MRAPVRMPQSQSFNNRKSTFMLHLKDGVSVVGIKPELLDGLLSLAVLFHQYELPLVVTALTDGVHKEGSLHYRGYAADLRSRDVPTWQLGHLLDATHQTLGLSWDVVQEVDHIHVEYDPHHDGGKGLS